MTLEDILPDIWNHAIFPGCLLHDLNALAQTTHTLRSLCFAFLETVSPTQLRGLVEPQPVRMTNLTSHQLREVLREMKAPSVMCYLPPLGIFNVTLIDREYYSTVVSEEHQFTPLFTWCASPSALAKAQYNGLCTNELRFYPSLDRIMRVAVAHGLLVEAKANYASEPPLKKRKLGDS
jgi:hypothetical protein